MNDTIVASLARNLSSYHQNSFRIRSMGRDMPPIELPMCVELENLANRLLGNYDPFDKLNRMAGLNGIIQQGVKETKELSRLAVNAKDATIYLEPARKVNAEIIAAQKLLEMLNG